jgi:hypothetical protein
MAPLNRLLTHLRACAAATGGWLAIHGSDVLKTIFGALIGAMLAFGSERHFRSKEIDERNLEAGLSALATLRNMEHVVFTSYCVAVAPFPNSKWPWLEFEWSTYDFPEIAPIDTGSLSFLMAAGRMNLLQKVLSAQISYNQYASQVSLRNKLLYEVLIPVIDKMGGADRSLDVDEFERRVAMSTGMSPIYQANQAARVMWESKGIILLFRAAMIEIHAGMKAVLSSGVPDLPPEHWPSSAKVPNCSVIKKNGSFLAGPFDWP